MKERFEDKVPERYSAEWFDAMRTAPRAILWDELMRALGPRPACSTTTCALYEGKYHADNCTNQAQCEHGKTEAHTVPDGFDFGYTTASCPGPRKS
jgi:hypothetical protein